MTGNEAEHDIQRFQAAMSGNAGASAFPALAEAHRRDGRPEEAERVARHGLERRPDALAGRVALGLALLDLGRTDEARAELERVLTSVPDHPLALAGLEASEEPMPAARPDEPFAGDLDGGEIDAAFEAARPEEDQMISADRVAARAIRAAELGEPEGFSDAEADFPIATRTVADLLERQGHAHDAQTMRATLDGEGDDRVIATLERWLDNLRRTSA
jgi:tetratricopeptide (TPR) repeat protein